MVPDFNRRAFLSGTAAAFASIGIVRAPARAATYQYKFACNTTIDHPLTVRARQMWDAVKAETHGRLEVQLFPNSQLGGDTAMLAQLRSGAIQFFTLSGGILNTVVPVAGIQGVPFAFKTSPQVQAAFDGPLGAYVRKEIAGAGMYAFPKILENGFRQITSSTHPIKSVEDLNGFKIRTPSGRLWVDLFKTLGAEVSPLNVSEVYSALQTHIIDGQENPYIVIAFDRFEEVQKYLSVTNHMWDGYWLLANGDAWKNLPPDIQSIVSKHAVIYARDERRDSAIYNDTLADKLRRQGLIFNTANTASFKPKLTGFYARWKTEFGQTAWSLLETTSGRLG